MKRSTMVTLAIVAALVAYLAWSTLQAQQVTCEVCVNFEGRANCASASAATEDEAAESAQRTACGPVASGMNESIACSNRPAASRQCTTR